MSRIPLVERCSLKCACVVKKHRERVMKVYLGNVLSSKEGQRNECGAVKMGKCIVHLCIKLFCPVFAL